MEPTGRIYQKFSCRLCVQKGTYGLNQTAKRSLFGIHDIEGVRLSIRLQVQFSDLREHKLRHNFQCSSSMCFCQTGTENNKLFLLHCPRHSSHRRDLLDRISNVVDVDPENLSSTDLCNLLSYGNSHFWVDNNHHIIQLSKVMGFKVCNLETSNWQQRSIASSNIETNLEPG